MKIVNTQMVYRLTDSNDTKAEVRTWGGKWTADAQIQPMAVGEHGDSAQARAALVKKLRELADVIERDA